MSLPPRPEMPPRSAAFRPIVNPKYYDPEYFKDVAYIKDLTEEELAKAESSAISRYCEHLIRSGVNSPYILEKYLGRADLNYVDKNNNNLLVIAILSNNLKPIDILLKLKCPRDVKNTSHGFSAEDLSSFPSCHRTIREIFKKYPVVVEDEEITQVSPQVPQVP